MKKLFRLIEAVDWRDISTRDKRRLLEREVDVTQLPPEILQQRPDIGREKAGMLSLDRLKEIAAGREKLGVKPSDQGKEQPPAKDREIER
jgi:hypothetical protein